jgi:predicted anti-sigma-YlaC factor YlaD
VEQNTQKTVIKNHITCRMVEEFLMAYLDRELGLWTRLRFKFHLLICSDCTNYLQEYKNTIALGNRLFNSPDEIAVNKVPDEILQAIINVVKTD